MPVRCWKSMQPKESRHDRQFRQEFFEERTLEPRDPGAGQSLRDCFLNSVNLYRAKISSAARSRS